MKDYFFGASKPKTVEHIFCKRCQEEHIGYLEQKGPHIGLYCTGCAGYIKWLSKAEIKQIQLQRAQKDFEQPVHQQQLVKDTGPSIDYGECDDGVIDDKDFDTPW